MREEQNKTEFSDLITSAISDRIFPGCTIALVNADDINVYPFGTYTYDVDAPLIQEDSIFDIASITKSIPTSSLAIWLIQEGKLGLYDFVSSYLSTFNGQYKKDATIWNLLTQTLSYKHTLSAMKNESADEIIEYLVNCDLKCPPGKSYEYTNTTSILLGLVVEEVAKKSLPELSENVFFRPLNMNSTTFKPSTIDEARIVPTEFDPWRDRLVVGEVHDESAYALQPKLSVGSAGLFSTAGDLGRFLQLFCQNDDAILTADSIEMICTNQCPTFPFPVGLGWELENTKYMGVRSKCIGKTGFTGCMVVCDIDKKIGIVMLSNAVHPRRTKDRALINAIRANLCEIIFRN